MTGPTACVIGWPIEHSRSPAIHKFWLNEFGIAGDYVKMAVAPEAIEGFLNTFADSGFIGGNVTVPHKEAALAAAAADDTARAIGAVNTLWMDGGKLIGSNTDAVGFLANLDACAKGWDKSPGAAVVLGAGGAARAVVWALLARGFNPVRLVNRTRGRAEMLADRFGNRVKPADWSELPRLLAGARLLVNTTTLGMRGAPALSVDLQPLAADAIVTDLVYVPLETDLLAAARARGLATVDGLGMLLHQAAPGFERWFGRKPKVSEELRTAVLATMGGK